MKTIVDILNGVSPAIAGYREKALDELTALQVQIAALTKERDELRGLVGKFLPVGHYNEAHGICDYCGEWRHVINPDCPAVRARAMLEETK